MKKLYLPYIAALAVLLGAVLLEEAPALPGNILTLLQSLLG